MFFLYSLLLGGVALLLSPYFLLQGARKQKYLHNFFERLGGVPAAARQAKPGALWLHAVSVGEVLAVEPLAAELRKRFPERKLVVTTTTRTGQELARQRLKADATFYFPFDFAIAARRALGAVKPALIVIAETELWPNFLRLAKRGGARVLIVNGRLSDRSFPRYRSWGFFFRRALANVDFFLMQTEEDARRLKLLGAPAERVAVGGNLKYDLPQPQRPAFLDQIAPLLDNQPFIVAGSTMPGEEKLVLDAVRRAREKSPEAMLLLAPRHPERFDDVAKLLEKEGEKFVRRSALAGITERPDTVLLDSMGELAGAYALATVAFVGGSLVPRGGHNPLEPALWGKAVLFGPSMENFRLIAERLVIAGGAVRVKDSTELGAQLTRLLTDRGFRAVMGMTAKDLVARDRGATARAAEKVAELLAPPAPKIPAVPATAPAAPLGVSEPAPPTADSAPTDSGTAPAPLATAAAAPEESQATEETEPAPEEMQALDQTEEVEGTEEDSALEESAETGETGETEEEPAPEEPPPSGPPAAS